MLATSTHLLGISFSRSHTLTHDDTHEIVSHSQSLNVRRSGAYVADSVRAWERICVWSVMIRKYFIAALWRWSASPSSLLWASGAECTYKPHAQVRAVLLAVLLLLKHDDGNGRDDDNDEDGQHFNCGHSRLRSISTGRLNRSDPRSKVRIARGFSANAFRLCVLVFVCVCNILYSKTLVG